MTDFIFIYIILIHFLADFGLQTNEQAVNKGQGIEWFNKSLFYHVGVYSLVWFIATLPVLGFWKALVFSVITFLCHYPTDWVTSRINKKFQAKGDIHNLFVTIGFDQVLHYLQLYYTFKLLL